MPPPAPALCPPPLIPFFFVSAKTLRLCAPNNKPPYLCIVIAPASRYIFHSFPLEETDAVKAFMHVLEGIVMAVLTEGMGMIDEVIMHTGGGAGGAGEGWGQGGYILHAIQCSCYKRYWHS